ncbi:MAG: hypothetical protein J6O54_00375 [Prevotella sp.]|jgi:hypothetical protein|nr:hypothetical protein [Prevotella sp.]
MKFLKYIVLLLLTLTVTAAEAKRLKTNQVYMFGFSASFKDSVIYVTDIQHIEGAWIETKNKFLMGRDNYSYQLKNHLAEKQNQPNRVCMVFYALSKKKAEKLYLKLMKKYKKGYEVRYMNATEFKFEAIDMSPDESQ